MVIHYPTVPLVLLVKDSRQVKYLKVRKCAGHLGDKQRTILSQQIIRIDAEHNLVLIRGAVPGAISGYVVIRPAIKKNA